MKDTIIGYLLRPLPQLNIAIKPFMRDILHLNYIVSRLQSTERWQYVWIILLLTVQNGDVMAWLSELLTLRVTGIHTAELPVDAQMTSRYWLWFNRHGCCATLTNWLFQEHWLKMYFHLFHQEPRKYPSSKLSLKQNGPTFAGVTFKCYILIQLALKCVPIGSPDKSYIAFPVIVHFPVAISEAGCWIMPGISGMHVIYNS